MLTSGRSEAELTAQKAASEKLLSGVATGVIDQAYETNSRRDNPMMVFKIIVTGADGLQRTYTDYLTDTPQGGVRLRHACAAVGVLAEFEAGRISPEMFAGREIKIKLKIERRPRYPARSVIEDYLLPGAAPVVNLRTVAKALVLLGGVSLAALTCGCSSALPSGPESYQPPQPPPSYNMDAPPGDAAPQVYASGAPSQPPVAPSKHNLGDMAMGAGVGAVGGMIANRAMSGETAARTGAAAEGVAEREAEERAAALVAAHEAEQRAAAFAARGAAGAVTGEAAGAAEAAEGDIIIDRLLLWLGEDWLLALAL
jgi:hypothetical protein